MTWVWERHWQCYLLLLFHWMRALRLPVQINFSKALLATDPIEEQSQLSWSYRLPVSHFRFQRFQIGTGFNPAFKCYLTVGWKRSKGLEPTTQDDLRYLTDAEKTCCSWIIKVYKYHGPGKHIETNTLLENDVVLTTYATIVSGVAKSSSLLHQLRWFRIILDEGMRNFEQLIMSPMIISRLL